METSRPPSPTAAGPAPMSPARTTSSGVRSLQPSRSTTRVIAGHAQPIATATSPKRKSTTRSTVQAASQIQHQPCRILEGLLDPHQEGHRLLAVDDAVVVGEREV